MSRRGPGEAGGEYALVLAAGVTAAAVLLLALGRTWAQTSVVTAGMPRQDIAVAGSAAVGWLRPLALVGLAGLVATVPTAGRWRRAVGAVTAAAGAAVTVGTLTARGAVDRAVVETARDTAAGVDAAAVDAAVGGAGHSAWQWVAVLAAVGLLVAGLAVVARARAWPPLSRRYEQPGTVPARPPIRQPAADGTDQQTDAQDLWRALDDGRDPTR